MIGRLIADFLGALGGMILIWAPPFSLVFFILELSKYRSADKSDAEAYQKRKKMLRIASLVLLLIGIPIAIFMLISFTVLGVALYREIYGS